MRPDKPSAGRTPVATGEEDTALKAVLKWIPIEVIGFYQAVMAAVPTEKSDFRLWLTVTTIPICAGWIAFATKPTDKDFAWRQILLAALAFVFWGAAVQSEVLKATVTWWETWMGTVVLIVGSVFLPIFDGLLMRLGLTQMK
jgi:hypothetical protein